MKLLTVWVAIPTLIPQTPKSCVWQNHKVRKFSLSGNMGLLRTWHTLLKLSTLKPLLQYMGLGKIPKKMRFCSNFFQEHFKYIWMLLLPTKLHRVVKFRKWRFKDVGESWLGKTWVNYDIASQVLSYVDGDHNNACYKQRIGLYSTNYFNRYSTFNGSVNNHQKTHQHERIPKIQLGGTDEQKNNTDHTTKISLQSWWATENLLRNSQAQRPYILYCSFMRVNRHQRYAEKNYCKIWFLYEFNWIFWYSCTPQYCGYNVPSIIKMPCLFLSFRVFMLLTIIIALQTRPLTLTQFFVRKLCIIITFS